MVRKRLPEVRVQKAWHKSGKGCWSLSLGWRGCRVRVVQREPDGVFYRITWVGGRQDWASLRTTSRTEAQHLAEEFVRAQFELEQPSSEPLTLGALWTQYQQEAAGYKENTERTRADKRAAVSRLSQLFGANKRIDLLTTNDTDRYALVRGSGKGWPDSTTTPPVRANAVRSDLATLRTMILWATKQRRPDGTWLLSENPLRGLKLPREENPNRPVATFDRFLAIREAIRGLEESAPQARGRERWVRLELALVLAEATGARVGAIRGLRWADIDFEGPSITFQMEFDKRGRTRVVPVPKELADELHGFRVRLGAVGDGWLFPCESEDVPWPREIFDQQLRIAERKAGVPHMPRGLWHTYRRKWATERGDLPLKALMAAGGWKDMGTLVTCYQHPTDEALLKVMAHPVKLRDRKAAGEGKQ